MHKINLKTSLVIILFCVLIMIAFFISLIYFESNSIDSLSSLNGAVYSFEEQDLIELAKNGTYSISGIEQLESKDQYNRNVIEIIFKNRLPIILLFCIILLIASMSLIIVMRKIQYKENERLIANINLISKGIIISDENSQILKLYRQLEEKFNDNLNDYKRLNSYLSHEQKNAIAILRTNLELTGNKTYLQNLDNISDSIDDILTISEGLETIPTTTVDVVLVCAKVCDHYSKLQDNIEFEFDEENLAEIIAKERWLFRALANLVDNAIKYGKGNPIKVIAKVIHETVVIEVKDYGMGISEDKQKQIFRNRYRIDELNKDGYGIGLSLVSHVCNLCGGFVAFESELNKGTSFYLSFPIK